MLSLYGSFAPALGFAFAVIWYEQRLVLVKQYMKYIFLRTPLQSLKFHTSVNKPLLPFLSLHKFVRRP